MSRLSNLYLLAYNAFQACGWAVCLYKILGSFALIKSVDGAYSSAGDLICILQSAAFLEVIHGAIGGFLNGLVPSGALLPLMQWGGRTHFLLAIVRQITEIQQFASVFITFLAWSLSEIIRYSHNGLNCLGNCPSWITCLRYNAFIILYPIGVGPGEIWLMYKALPFVKEKNLYADFFSHFSLSYYDFLWVLLVIYPFLWLKLYVHMFKQRRSKLRKLREKIQ